MNVRVLLSLAWFSGLAVPAAATDSAWQHCRSISDDVARLACYDALDVKEQANAKSDEASNAMPPAPAAVPVTTTPAATSTDNASAEPQKIAEFGLEKKLAEQVESISSRIPGRFTGWQAKSKITLENGQIWQVVDGSRGQYLLENPQVKIERGVFGSFFLNIEGANKSPKVKRIQ